MNKLMSQILKFGAVGFLCFFIDYGILVALVELLGVDKLIHIHLPNPQNNYYQGRMQEP